MCMAVSWMQAKPSIMLFSLRNFFSETFHQVSPDFFSWYISQQLKVRWSNNFSEPFNTSNGVCQGGVLSPILFTIYIDLLSALECNGVVCFWNHHFVSAVCYVDDVALLAPSPSGFRIMLKACINLLTNTIYPSMLTRISLSSFISVTQSVILTIS